ncbi:hypothetical protein, conserved [Leishmania tarentolae]|uniref:Uncharacterized protein n=1 Tax=Leishmania tarentolae TaxID=5689 RepID=A0A640KDA7_LEITA|nr:hypothetical protein, conserved [Leishmania tarentolae]
MDFPTTVSCSCILWDGYKLAFSSTSVAQLPATSFLGNVWNSKLGASAFSLRSVSFFFLGWGLRHSQAMPPKRPTKPPGGKSVRKLATNGTKMRTPSLQEVYIRSCAEMGLRPNSAFTSLLPDKSGVNYAEDTVDLSRNYVGDKGIAPILSTIEKMPNVRALILCENGLRNHAVELLCTSAANLPNLEFIELSDNYISDGAAVALFRLIEHHRQLQAVVFENTKIPVHWRVKLLDALALKRSAMQKQDGASILVK